VHRDIKPENILLHMQPDGTLQAKILDFGIAAMTENITNLSRTHALLLTPEYAAPEQWRGIPSTELDGEPTSMLSAASSLKCSEGTPPILKAGCTSTCRASYSPSTIIAPIWAATSHPRWHRHAPARTGA
jgi:serine/threonine protein kinase